MSGWRVIKFFSSAPQASAYVTLYLHWEPLKYSTSAEECLKTHHWQGPMHPVLFWCSVPARSPFHLAFRDWFGQPTFGFISRAPLELMVDHHFPYYPDLTWPLCVSLVDKPWQTHLRERGWGWECSWSDFWVPSTVSFLVCCKRPSTSAVPKIHARAARAPVGSFKPNPTGFLNSCGHVGLSENTPKLPWFIIICPNFPIQSNGNLGVWVVPKFGGPLHLACGPAGEVAAELSCDGPCQRATRSGATPRDFGGG